MDLDLPILDGIAATQKIRQQEHMESVPIVAATAYPLSYSRVRVVQSLSQPLTPEFVQTNLIARVIISARS